MGVGINRRPQELARCKKNLAARTDKNLVTRPKKFLLGVNISKRLNNQKTTRTDKIQQESCSKTTRTHKITTRTMSPDKQNFLYWVEY